VLRGEVYEVDFGPGVGREPSGPHPAVIVSNDTLNVAPFALIVVPGILTTSAATHRWIGVEVTAAESGLAADTTFLCYRISSVDPSRVKPGPLATLPAARMADIDHILLSLLGLNTPPSPPPPPGRRTAPRP